MIAPALPSMAASEGAAMGKAPDGVSDADAQRLVRLAPSHRDPEAFHLEKHTVAAELRRLASDMRRGAA